MNTQEKVKEKYEQLNMPTGLTEQKVPCTKRVYMIFSGAKPPNCGYLGIFLCQDSVPMQWHYITNIQSWMTNIFSKDYIIYDF